MRNSKSPAFLPVDHRANLSQNRVRARAVADELPPWPVRRRIGAFVALALASWIVALSPILLFG
jgi:hypothetical protein